MDYKGNVITKPYIRSISDKFLEHSFQKFCGIILVEQQEGYCITEFIVNTQLANISNKLHAGILYSALDSTAFLAALTSVDEKSYPVTHSMNVSILSPVSLDTVVNINAKVIKKGKRLIFIDARAYFFENNEKILVAQSTIIKSILTNILT